jgi:hypothetical protein
MNRMHDKFCPLSEPRKKYEDADECHYCQMLSHAREDERKIAQREKPLTLFDQVFIEDEPRHRHRAKDEGMSKAGAYDVIPRARTQKAKLLAAYAEVMSGMPSSEACQRAGISLAAGYRARVSELRDQGLIEPVRDSFGEIVSAEGALGSDQTVDRITDKGRAALRTIAEMRK